MARMTADWLIPTVVMLPLIGAFALLALRRVSEQAAAKAGTLVCLATLVIAVAATLTTSDADRLEVDVAWIPALGLRGHLGLDGVSAPLVLMTSLLGLLVCAHLVKIRPE